MRSRCRAPVCWRTAGEPEPAGCGSSAASAPGVSLEQAAASANLIHQRFVDRKGGGARGRQRGGRPRTKADRHAADGHERLRTRTRTLRPSAADSVRHHRARAPGGVRQLHEPDARAIRDAGSGSSSSAWPSAAGDGASSGNWPPNAWCWRSWRASSDCCSRAGRPRSRSKQFAVMITPVELALGFDARVLGFARRVCVALAIACRPLAVHAGRRDAPSVAVRASGHEHRAGRRARERSPGGSCSLPSWRCARSS